MLQKRIYLLFGVMIILTFLSENPNIECRNSDLIIFEDNKIHEISDQLLLNTHMIQIDVPKANEVFVTEIYNLENRLNYSITSLTLWLNHSCNNLKIEGTTGIIDFEILYQTSSSYHLNLNFNTDILVNDTVVFYVSYNLEMMPIYLTDSKYYYLEFTSSINFFTLNYYVSIKLPENCYLHEESGLTSVFPTNQTQSFAGKRLIVSWSMSNLLPFTNPLFLIRYDPPSLDSGKVPIWVLILGPMLGIVLGIVSTYLLMRRKEEKSLKDIGTVFLNESQKTLLRIIKASGGKIAQNELGRKADFSRAKTSRNLLLLEEQGLVRKEKWGRNSLVYLTKAGEKVTE